MQIENDYDKEVYNGDIGFVELTVSRPNTNCRSNVSAWDRRSGQRAILAKSRAGTASEDRPARDVTARPRI